MTSFVMDHIVLATRDLDRMIEFYVEVVGLAPHRVDAYRRGEVPFPCARLSDDTIVDFLPEALWNFGGETSGHANLHHFCLCVDAAEWADLLARVERAGIEIEAGPMTLSGARGDGVSVYVRDPDGNRVELRHYP